MVARLQVNLPLLGFCGIEMIVYSQNTGAYTILIIEGSRAENESLIIAMIFYKQNLCYPHGSKQGYCIWRKANSPTIIKTCEAVFEKPCKHYLGKQASFK